MYDTSIHSDQVSQPTGRPRIRRAGFLKELLDLIVLIGAIYALVNLATVRFIVQGPSMEPTFSDNQFLIVSRVNYLVGEPQRGDIVVFHYPRNTEEDYIKRVLGLPGETVEFRDTLLYIDGNPIDEPYINEPCTPNQCRDNTWELGEGEYFMLGDNRNRSQDSRNFDQVSREYIVGEVMIRYWPPQDWGLVSKINFPRNQER